MQGTDGRARLEGGRGRLSGSQGWPDRADLGESRAFDRDALARVEREHRLEQRERHRVGVGVDLLDGDRRLAWQGADVPLRLLRLDALNVVVRGSADHVGDQIELVDVVLAREEGLAAQQLGEDAADRPDVDGLGVLLPREHDLRRAVPSRRHVLGHEARVVLLWVRNARQPKVAHLPKTGRARALVSCAARAWGRAGGRALRSQLPLRSRLLGFRSRCSTCAE